jgi:hypothetical protein
MDFVCIKTSCGDEIFATLTEFRDPLKRIIEVMYPMELSRDVQVDDFGRVQKIVKLAPYFPFASDRIFRLNTAHLIHINPLAEDLIRTYKDCVDAYNRMDETPQPEEQPVRKPVHVDIKVEDADDAADTFFVQGNDTIN